MSGKDTPADPVLLDEEILKFWTVEDLPGSNLLAKPVQDYTPEEQFVSQHYSDTTKLNNDGQYVVKLPRKPAEMTGGVELVLGDSLPQATKSLLGTEKSCVKKPEKRVFYNGFMQSYIDHGHLVKVDPALLAQIPNHRKFYLPHHGVEKESTTTPFRVVVNGSARSSTGVSLNDTLAVGPTLQPQLVVTLIAFQMHVYAFTGDISKMYRQILLDESERFFHLVLYRFDTASPIETYCMHRVSYGVTSSCYHAVRTLHEIANRSVDASTEVKDAIINGFYVDDLMTGAATEEGAKSLLDGMIKTLGDAGFPIRKFASNCSKLVTDLPPELRENEDAFDVSSPDHFTHSLKILGVRWIPAEDCFVFLINHIEFTEKEVRIVTKRQLLADIMKLFDPVGFMAPVTLLLKAFMQTTWEQGLGWDEPLPKETRDEFLEWRSHLVDLRSVRVPRCLLPKGIIKSIQLHVYCDASETGYGACVYIRAVNEEGRVYTRLVMAKARVSPVKQQSIPRLELLGATIGVKLIQIVTTAFTNARFKCDAIFAYTDSTTVLAWLSRNSRVWVTFVSNRVSAILEVVQRKDWYHVKTKENPADLLSRGCHPGELVKADEWWFGPKEIRDVDFVAPNQDHLVPEDTTLDMKKETSHCFFLNQPVPASDEESPTELFMDLAKTSRLEWHIRVTVYVLRFVSRLKRYRQPAKDVPSRNEMLVSFNKKFGRATSKTVSPQEATYVRTLFIQREQQMYLGEEVRLLQQGKELHKSSSLHKLYPFMDEGTMKVGGRLAASASISDDQKYPSIVPGKSRLAWLLIDHAHRQTFHGTQQGCLAAIRAKYWVVGANPKVRKYIRSCVKCARFVTKPSVPLMGDLPKERVSVSQPWDHTGVDFAGPFNIRAYIDAPPKPTVKKAAAGRPQRECPAYVRPGRPTWQYSCALHPKQCTSKLWGT